MAFKRSPVRSRSGPPAGKKAAGGSGKGRPSCFRSLHASGVRSGVGSRIEQKRTDAWPRSGRRATSGRSEPHTRPTSGAGAVSWHASSALARRAVGLPLARCRLRHGDARRGDRGARGAGRGARDGASGSAGERDRPVRVGLCCARRSARPPDRVRRVDPARRPRLGGSWFQDRGRGTAMTIVRTLALAAVLAAGGARADEASEKAATLAADAWLKLFDAGG